MATDRQIAANRQNATHSTGPKTPEGKAASRLNATVHGLAGTTTEAILGYEGDRGQLDDRKARWARDFRPMAGAGEAWLFERVVAESIRVDRCGDAYFALCRLHGHRAIAQWDEDRRRDAEELAAGLARYPSRVARKLEATPQGCDLKIELWGGLAAHLARHADWTAPQRSLALDLLGVHPDLREAETAVDPAEGDAPEARRRLAVEELGRLEGLRDGGLARLDATERALAEKTLGAEFTRPMILLDRYERAAIRRQQWAWKALVASQKLGKETPATTPPPARAKDKAADPISTAVSALKAMSAGPGLPPPERDAAVAVGRSLADLIPAPRRSTSIAMTVAPSPIDAAAFDAILADPSDPRAGDRNPGRRDRPSFAAIGRRA